MRLAQGSPLQTGIFYMRLASEPRPSGRGSFDSIISTVRKKILTH
jgi:hypothetical protein